MPGATCAVANCDNSHCKTKSLDRKVSYFRFPKDPIIRRKWIHNCKRKDKFYPDSCHVCSDRFTENDFEINLKTELLGLLARPKLKKTSLPTVNLGNTENENIKQSNERKNRVLKRNGKNLIEKLLDVNKQDKGEESLNKCNNCKTLEDLNFKLKHENSILNMKIKHIEIRMQAIQRNLKFWKSKTVVIQKEHEKLKK
ncbi:52 kDa repressor of the inhibitor of the protein kinase-like [Centruroides sculpturatus]|uniref:52 kDa repressor of the inhibitor of the protein kinase-like n=1 Tax=Centruroides sculpturatus TaxID=218467 RepID=UPI000C6E3D14|nr:52 kDa repressor of the inhibitor of the protein kinase-like [Centruroides sculpturatus]